MGKYKGYSHSYHDYNFYAEDTDDMIIQLTKLIIIAQDRNFAKRRLLNETDPVKRKEYQIELECAQRQYNEIRKELENPYRKD